MSSLDTNLCAARPAFDPTYVPKTSTQESCALLLQMGLSIHGAVISLQVAINIP
jgi:hypothetical protein